MKILAHIAAATLACLAISAQAGQGGKHRHNHHQANCKTYAQWVGDGKITMVDFRGKDPSSPFIFRLKFHEYQSKPADGFMGAITQGSLTFSYPRQKSPEVAYVKGAPFPAPYTQGPAFGEKVDYQARELACNIFEVHWKENNKGDTVTHVQDFSRKQVCTNITNLNRKTIPAGFDQFDINNQLNNRQLFPEGSPVAAKDFGFFNLCGNILQSAESERVWEDQLGFLVYESPQ
jgi:hypothetical protein